MQFKAVCSKWNQKLTLSLSAGSVEEARSLLHGQGYSIMEITEIQPNQTPVSSSSTNENFFYFDVYINGQLKSGKIQSYDVFKAYKKLVDDLWYNIQYIYTTEWMSEDQKKIITAKVKDGYVMYKQSLWIDVNERTLSEKESEMADISPQVLKELEHYNQIIDSTTEKLQNLILKYHNTISPEKKIELENIENTLVQSKWWSNLGRIRTIVENALTVVGRIEAELIKWWHDKEKIKLLEETNSLLKQIGSNERIETENDGSQDVMKGISNFFSNLSKKEESKIEQKTKKIDTNTFIFYKNLRELNIYKANLHKVAMDIIKSSLSFDFERVKRLRLKKRLLEQDIQIIDNRIHNRNISYTKIVKWTRYYTDNFFILLWKIWDIMLYGLVIYFTLYILLNTLSHFWFLTNYSLQPKAFLYITVFSVLTFVFSFFRSLLLFLFGIGVFLLFFIFLSVNF